MNKPRIILEPANRGSTVIEKDKINLILDTSGARGPKGERGEIGPPGTPGPRGLSAYEVWLEEGNEGTVDDYLASIKGDTGEVTQEEFDGLEQELNQHKLDYTSQRQQDQLKVATVEKDLNDYKKDMSNINIHQDSVQSVSGVSPISLPNTVGEGSVDFSLKGITEGTKSITMPKRIRSEGKNVFDLTRAILPVQSPPSMLYNGFLTPSTSSAYATSFFSYLIPPGDYYISCDFEQLETLTNVSISIRDIENYLTTYGNTSSSELKGRIGTKFTIPESSNGCLIYMYSNITDREITSSAKFTNFQIQKGIVDSHYEVYIEPSLQYIHPKNSDGSPVVLRSLPNQIADEIKDGKLIKRVEAYVVDDIVKVIGINNSVANVDILTIDGMPFVTNENDINYARLILPDGREITENKAWNIGIPWSYYQYEGNDLKLSIPKGTYTSILDANNKLKGTVIHIQSKKPISLPIKISGSLTGNSNGTVYIDDVVADASIYKTNFTIADNNLKIDSIDKLIKYNFADGTQQSLDVEEVVISENKLSFTHPSLTKDDMVFVDYYYIAEGINGLATVDYYDSRFTVKDKVNSKTYTWTIESSNGEPTVKLTEVL